MPRCRFVDCTVKQAIFNIAGETQGICCSKHKEDDMIDVVHKKCISEGCNIIPNYNYSNEKTPLYCATHKLDNMINIINKKCISEGCNIIPIYNLPGEKIGVYCLKHKDENMIDVVSKICISEGCNTRPCFNYDGEIVPIYCVKHKEDDMIDIKSKRCIYEGCNIQPSYNFPGEKTPLYCVKHKEDDMIDIRNKNYCIIEGCNIRASYNLPGEIKVLYCVKHKLENMIDIKSNTCIQDGCSILSTFNLPGEKTPLYCTKHKLDNMVDIKHKTCIHEGCKVIVQNTKQKYRGYCIYCFMNIFPDEPVTYNYKVKEKHVADFVNIYFKEYIEFYDKQIQGGCSKKRPDIFIDLFTHSIIIEVDENQHFDYSCENKRMMLLFQDLANRPIVFIRFNPDKYIDENGETIKSCFKYHKTTGVPMIDNKVEWNKRLENLKNTIEKYINNIPEKEVTIVKLFYNNF